MALAGPAAGAQDGFAQPIAFVGVDVLPMDTERVLENQTVLVSEGRIREMGPRDTLDPGQGTRVIDGEGLYLMPGLAEMHAHVPGADADPDYRRRVLFLFVANGITTMRGMLGEPAHLELRSAIAAGRIVGPRLYTSGPSFNGNSVTSPAQAVDMARAQKSAGYDFFKIHPGLTRAEFDALAAEASALDMPFAGHVSEQVGLERVLAAGQASIDHLDSYMQALAPASANVDGGFFGFALMRAAVPGRIPGLARDTARARVWNVPTQTLIENFVLPEDPEELRRRAEIRYMPPAVVEQWASAKRQLVGGSDYDPEAAVRFVELRRRLIRALHEAGAGLLLGSDAPQVFNVPGFSAHRELGLLVASGLTPYEALRAGTAAPARFFGATQTFGTVTRGLDADLVLLEANPLENIDHVSRIAGVMLRGRWLSRVELDEGLRQLEPPVVPAKANHPPVVPAKAGIQ
jgi:imidazolonepropionase-like amidohydrolase